MSWKKFYCSKKPNRSIKNGDTRIPTVGTKLRVSPVMTTPQTNANRSRTSEHEIGHNFRWQLRICFRTNTDSGEPNGISRIRCQEHLWCETILAKFPRDIVKPALISTKGEHNQTVEDLIGHPKKRNRRKKLRWEQIRTLSKQQNFWLLTQSPKQHTGHHTKRYAYHPTASLGWPLLILPEGQSCFLIMQNSDRQISPQTTSEGAEQVLEVMFTTAQQLRLSKAELPRMWPKTPHILVPQKESSPTRKAMESSTKKRSNRSIPRPIQPTASRKRQ